MAVIFFDTSALVKRYDEFESGASTVRTLCRRTAGHFLSLSAITPVEVAAALNRKVREAQITAQHRDRGWRLFRADVRDQYRVIPLDERTYALAASLLFRHPLRAYDAVQIATALITMRWLTDVAPDFRFCTADRNQAATAEREGLNVEFIA